LLATDYAAMAPFTTIGSAQPILGSEPVNDTKVINALTEKAESLADLHGRNTTQAVRFITDNDNLTHQKARRYFNRKGSVKAHNMCTIIVCSKFISIDI
jgi:membrane-bound serine protease (ClpP class)